MTTDGRRQRFRSAAAVLLLHLLLAFLLVVGLRVQPVPAPDQRLAAFDVDPVLPPPPEKPVPRDARDAPQLNGVRTDIIADPAPVEATRSAEESPLLASPIPASGDAASGGGAGTDGSGAGAGGDGGGGGIAMPARKVEGLISNRDYPRPARRSRAEGRVVSRLRIDSDGRVFDCSVHRSSGHEMLDRATCELIRARFRFAPARDAAGRPVPDQVDWETIWWLGW